MEASETHPSQLKSGKASECPNPITLVFLHPESPKDSFTFTITKEEEETVDMLTLRFMINQKLNAFIEFADCFGNSIWMEGKVVSYYRNLQPFYIERLRRKNFENPSCQIFVRLMTGRILTILASLSYTVADVKELVFEQTGDPPNKIRLFLERKHLYDESTLESYGISKEAKLDLTLRLRGGGGTIFSFPDITNEDKAQIHQWSKSAPRWRTFCLLGLCLEGVCQNEKCEAKGRWVIMSKGDGVYDIILDKHLNKCPMCQQYVEAEKVAFTSCFYRYVGTKIEEGKPPQKVVSKEIEVGDHYKLFDPEMAGSANWTSLKIVTRAENKATAGLETQRFKALEAEGMESLCIVCSKKVSVSPTTLDCGHHFHDECYQAIKGLNIKCASCHL